MRQSLFAALIGAALPLCPLYAAEAEFIGSYTWSEAWEGFGGYSGIEVAADGMGFLVVSDRAMLVEGRFTRDAEGRITGAESTDREPLRDRDGAVLAGPRGDSEGLAIGPDGLIYISMEGEARIRRQDGLRGRPTVLPRHPDFAGMQPNASLEALAIGPDGAIYTMPERSGRVDRPFPVYRYLEGEWTIPFSIPRRGSFLVSGADIGPDGLLYVLERDFTGFGFRTRVRRFDLDGGSETTLLQTLPLIHDNLEGISVWADDAGLRMTLVSDDNQRRLQRTEFVEYRIVD